MQRAISSIITLIILLILFFNSIIFPIYKTIITTINNFFSPYTHTTSLLPITTTIIVEIIKWIVFIFTNPLPLAILIAINILILLLEFKWS